MLLQRHPTLPFSATARPGFTLVELLVVMTIILILAGLVFGVATGVNARQARSKAETQMAAIAMALESYKLKHTDYPWLGSEDNADELFKHLTGQLKMKPTSTPGEPQLDAPGDGKPYLDGSKMSVDIIDGNEQFVDPWGQAYQYYYKSSGNYSSWPYSGFILVSGGPDLKIADDEMKQGKLSADHFDDDENADNLVFGMDF